MILLPHEAQAQSADLELNEATRNASDLDDSFTTISCDLEEQTISHPLSEILRKLKRG